MVESGYTMRTKSFATLFGWLRAWTSCPGTRASRAKADQEHGDTTASMEARMTRVIREHLEKDSGECHFEVLSKPAFVSCTSAGSARGSTRKPGAERWTGREQCKKLEWMSA